MFFLASAGSHLSKIAASFFSFKIEITIFNKWRALTCVPQVTSLYKNSLFLLSIDAVGTENKIVVQAFSLLAGHCLGQTSKLSNLVKREFEDCSLESWCQVEGVGTPKS